MPVPKELPTNTTKPESFESMKKDERYRRIDAIFEESVSAKDRELKILKRREKGYAIQELTDKQRKQMRDYLTHMQRRGLKLESQRGYLQSLKTLFLQTGKSLDEITKDDIDKYLLYLDKNYKPHTIKDRRIFLMKFFEWFHNKPKHEIDLIKNIKVKGSKGTKLPDELLTPEEVKRLVQVADNFRDKVIVVLLYETAARKGEFCQLKIKHVELHQDASKKYAFITLPAGKTTTRKIPIIYALPHLINWLNSHPNRDNPDAPLFVTLGSYLNRALGEDGLTRMLKILGRRAKINKTIYPHLFRHSRLTELAKELTEQELKIYAGWTPDSNMASTYVHLAGGDVSDKLLSNAGLIDSKAVNKARRVLMQVECPICHALNPADTKICSCGTILDIKEAQSTINNYKSVEQQMAAMQAQLKEISAALIQETKKKDNVNSMTKDELIALVKALKAQK